MSAIILPASPDTPLRRVEIRIHDRRSQTGLIPRLETYLTRGNQQVPLSRHPAWLEILERGLKHVPYCLEAVKGEETRGFLALVYVHSLLFGRFLVGLPYLNYGGVIADDEFEARLLIDHAVRLADQLDVRYLELREETATEHPMLVPRPGSKVHMRLALPATSEELWQGLSAKVRNQVRKSKKSGLTVTWGGQELLAEFYEVFSHNMRDLGTPVYGRGLFRSILDQFPERAELCVIRCENQAAAAAMLLHGWGISEVPSASSLRRYNSKNPNMLLYFNLLERAIRRGQAMFDFGRSSPDSGTYRFKKQWGAESSPSTWQYYQRAGNIGDMRPDNPRYRRLIRLWQRLPVGLTRLIGPPIVRGIP